MCARLVWRPQAHAVPPTDWSSSNDNVKGVCASIHMYATYVQYVQGTFKVHSEIAKEVATAAPYKEWVNSNHRLEDLVPTNQYLQETQMELSQVLRLQAANGTNISTM